MSTLQKLRCLVYTVFIVICFIFNRLRLTLNSMLTYYTIMDFMNNAIRTYDLEGTTATLFSERPMQPNDWSVKGINKGIFGETVKMDTFVYNDSHLPHGCRKSIKTTMKELGFTEGRFEMINGRLKPVVIPDEEFFAQ
jgi:hypothetical protein